MSGVTFSYGSFKHRPCEVYPRRHMIENIRGQNGIVWAQKRILEIGGDLIGNNGAEMTANEVVARMALVDAAYANEYQDIAFTMPDGSTKVHQMLNNDLLNLSGNRIVYKSWEHLHPGELANTRSFSVRFEATYRVTNYNIFEYRENTTRIGRGGPIWRLYETANGGITKVQVSDVSKVVHITSGSLISATPVNAPASLWPDDEQEWKSEVTKGTPMDFGHPTAKFTGYRTTWRYYHERIGPDPTTSPPRFVIP